MRSHRLTSQPTPKGKLAAVLCLVAAMLGWGVIPIFLRYFTTFLDPWTVNGVRYSVGALFWLPFIFLLDRRGTQSGNGSAPQSVWRAAIVPSAVNVFGQVGYGLSPYFAPASTVGFVIRLSFLFTIFFGFLFLAEERLLARKGRFWLGAGISVVGVLLMFLDKLREGGETSLVGLAIIVASSVAWGGYAVSVRRCMAAYPARQSFGVISLYTSVVLVLLMLLFGRVGTLRGIDGRLWAYLMGSAVVGIAFGHVLYYQGIHRLGPVVSNGIMLATPFVTYLVAALALGEKMGGVELAGGVLVVAGGGFLVHARAQIDREADEVSSAPR